ncbi:MAG TPA: hypothetical protein VM577_05520 [Anaerovoracaceae bacterium]|nr:hypothetical protein [Anaerovoracaceae bacterium]
MKNAVDLVHDYADRVLGCPTLNRQPMPGEFISHLPEEEREVLRTLKSDDLQKSQPILPIWLMMHNESFARRKGILYDYQGRIVVKLETNVILR